MALVIDLKPAEKVLIGEAVITNGDQRTRLHIDGTAPIIREKDILKEEDANTPCRRIYFLVQCMYMAGSSDLYTEKYFEMVKEVQHAAPTTALFILDINEQIMAGAFYKALKIAKELIEYEEELIANATKPSAAE